MSDIKEMFNRFKELGDNTVVMDMSYLSSIVSHIDKLERRDIDIKACTYGSVSDILKYEFDGEYSEKGISDFFDDYADKMARGEL